MAGAGGCSPVVRIAALDPELLEYLVGPWFFRPVVLYQTPVGPGPELDLAGVEGQGTPLPS